VFGFFDNEYLLPVQLEENQPDPVGVIADGQSTLLSYVTRFSGGLIHLPSSRLRGLTSR
jgi:hypothetical protein